MMVMMMVMMMMMMTMMLRALVDMIPLSPILLPAGTQTNKQVQQRPSLTLLKDDANDGGGDDGGNDDDGGGDDDGDGDDVEDNAQSVIIPLSPILLLAGTQTNNYQQCQLISKSTQ